MVIVAEWSNALDCGSSSRKTFGGSNPLFHPMFIFYLCSGTLNVHNL